MKSLRYKDIGYTHGAYLFNIRDIYIARPYNSYLMFMDFDPEPGLFKYGHWLFDGMTMPVLGAEKVNLEDFYNRILPHTHLLSHMTRLLFFGIKK